MTLDECKPGQKVWWKQIRHHFITWKAVRIIRVMPRRVEVFVNLFGQPARRYLSPGRLSKSLRGTSLR